MNYYLIALRVHFSVRALRLPSKPAGNRYSAADCTVSVPSAFAIIQLTVSKQQLKVFRSQSADSNPPPPGPGSRFSRLVVVRRWGGKVYEFGALVVCDVEQSEENGSFTLIILNLYRIKHIHIFSTGFPFSLPWTSSRK